MTTYKSAFSTVLTLAVVGTLAAPQMTAQTVTTVTGTILDAVSGKPVSGVGITVLGSDLTTTTGADGTYTLTGVPPGLIKVKAQIIGFHPITTPYYNLKPGESEHVNFKLAPLQVQLPAIEVRGERPEERQWAFGSSILTSEQLPTQGSVLDALQGTVAGLRTYGSKDDQGVSFRNSRQPALYVINGVVVTPPLTFYIDVNEVECVEVRSGYRAAQEFRLTINGPNYSGVILIWTRGSIAPRPRECGNK